METKDGAGTINGSLMFASTVRNMPSIMGSVSLLYDRQHNLTGMPRQADRIGHHQAVPQISIITSFAPGREQVPDQELGILGRNAHELKVSGEFLLQSAPALLTSDKGKARDLV